MNLNEVFAQNRFNMIGKQNISIQKEVNIDKIKESDLNNVKFLGDKTILELFKAGYTSIEEVKKAGYDKIISSIDIPVLSRRGIKEIFNN